MRGTKRENLVFNIIQKKLKIGGGTFSIAFSRIPNVKLLQKSVRIRVVKDG
jgi:hypothetical protein